MNSRSHARLGAEKTEPDIQGPAVVGPDYIRDRQINTEDGAPILGKKGYRRIDGLRWLLDHKSIEEHQFLAGRRLQCDWEMSKLEVCPRSGGSGGRGAPSSNLSDSKLDAMTRYADAMAVIPTNLVTLMTLFLLPEDHPLSLERCAAMVKRNQKAASFGVQIGLDLLARHYGYST